MTSELPYLLSLCCLTDLVWIGTTQKSRIDNEQKKTTEALIGILHRLKMQHQTKNWEMHMVIYFQCCKAVC